LNSPPLDDPDLAYESGVHLGDGNLWGYRYVISGNKLNETCYYEEVLAPLVSRLFSLSPKVVFENNSVYLRVYSKDLVMFKHNILGFPIGPKVDLRIPPPLCLSNQNTAEVLSGLYDTDGSVKIRHDKSGDYPRISLGQKCRPLVQDTRDSLSSLGIPSTMYRNDYYDCRSNKVETRWFLDINGFRNFNLFVEKIGTRSPYVQARIDVIDKIR
jgi:hypothetical protein